MIRASRAFALLTVVLLLATACGSDSSESTADNERPGETGQVSSGLDPSGLDPGEDDPPEDDPPEDDPPEDDPPEDDPPEDDPPVDDPPEPGDAGALRVGECIQDNTKFGEQELDFFMAPCDEAHNAEAYAVGQVEVGGDPQEYAEGLCYGDEFEDYVGEPYSTSQIFAYFFGTADGEIVCLLWIPEDPTAPLTSAGVELTESLEGANR